MRLRNARSGRSRTLVRQTQFGKGFSYAFAGDACGGSDSLARLSCKLMDAAGLALQRGSSRVAWTAV